MISTSTSFFSKRPGVTIGGIFSLALSSVLLLCGAGSVPVENLLPQGAMQGDLNAGGHNISNVAAITATNSISAPNFLGDPYSALNYSASEQEFIFVGDSIPAGGLLSNPFTQCYPYQFTQLAWAKNHGTYYNFSSGGSVIPANSTQGYAGTITPTTEAGTWTGATNSITLSGSNANIKVGELVSGPNIPFGTAVASISGTSLVLLPAIGQVSGTLASGSGVTLSFGGNDITDIYNAYIHPLRPSVTGVLRAFLFVHCGTNDVYTGFWTPAAVASNLATFCALAQADGMTVVLDTLAPRAYSTSWNGYDESNRALLNDLIRGGQAGVSSTYVHDVAKLYNPTSTYLNDTVHPNAATHLMMANDLNNFMQANGGLNGLGPEWNELLQANQCLLVGPTNDALIGDNIVQRYNNNGSGVIQFNLVNAGSGDGFYFDGTEIDDVFAPSGSAGGFVSAAGVTGKVGANGAFAFGPSVSATIGAFTGGSINGDASGNFYLPNLTTDGLLKTTGGTGKVAMATAGTDYIAPTGSGAGLSGVVLTGPSSTAQAIDTTGVLGASGGAALNVLNSTMTGGNSLWINLGHDTSTNYNAGVFQFRYDSSGNSGNYLTLGLTGNSYAFRVYGAGDVWDAYGNLIVDGPGMGLQVKEGSNGKQGTATLSSGSVTVSNTSVTANSRILLTTQTPGGTVGTPYVSARTAGTSFTIASTSSSDTSTVGYEIFEPAP